MNAPLIEIKGLCKRLGDFELKNVSLTLEPGYIMGFVGPNGAGKSTTIKLMLNLLRRQSGTVRIFGLDTLTHEQEIKQRIGFVLDDSYFFESMTIRQLEWFVGGVYRQWSSDTFWEYMRRFSITPKSKIKTLSTGMKAKLSMAVALSHNAELLILDEPTSGLDPVVREEILEELTRVVRDPERGVIFSTHITSDLDKIADFVTFIHKGQIVLSTTKDEIDEQYAVVRGAKKQFADVRTKLLRYKETEFGFDGLTDRARELRRSAGALVIEKAKIEDILLYYEKGALLC